MNHLIKSDIKKLDIDTLLSPQQIMLAHRIASPLSSNDMSSQHALGVSSLQYAAKHLEIPTHEQLNSPTIHFSCATGVPSGDANMKSVVHHNGIGSFGRPSAGITLSMSFVKKFVVRFANFGSSGP